MRRDLYIDCPICNTQTHFAEHESSAFAPPLADEIATLHKRVEELEKENASLRYRIDCAVNGEGMNALY